MGPQELPSARGSVGMLFMMIPDGSSALCAGPGTYLGVESTFPRYLAESGLALGDPQSFWAGKDQIFSTSCTRKGTPCRSASSCRGEFLDHCGQLLLVGRGKVGSQGSPHASHNLQSDVTSGPLDPDPLDASGHLDSR